MKRILAATLAALTGAQAVLWTPVVVLGVSALNMSLPNRAEASPAIFKQANAQYESGDIPSCVRTLERILFPSPKVGGNLLEEARKLYGISNFLLGKKDVASRVFKQVLAADPGARLNPKHVLDPSIADFFESLKGNVGRGSPAPRAVRRPSGPRSQGDPGIRGPRLSAAPLAGAQKGPFTGIFVKTTNIDRATVFANGIFIGTANQNIELEPGEHKITISAEGHETVSKGFFLKAREKLTISVNLPKEGAREAAAAAAAAAARQKEQARRARAAQEAQLDAAASAEAARMAQASKRKNAQPPRGRNPGKVDYNNELAKPAAGASLADEFFRDQAPAAQPPPQQGYNQGAPQGQGYPQGQPPQQPYGAQQQPYNAQQPPPQSGYGQPPPGYAQPQRQQRPPVQRQPAYVPPPQRAPQYQQQPGYAAPPLPPQAYQPQSAAQPGYGAPYAPPVQKPSNGRSSLLALLPFGVGQFQNEQSTKGWLFAAGGVGALGAYGYFIYEENNFKKANAAYEAQIAALEKNGANDELRAKYAQEKKDYLTAKVTQQTLSLAGFGLVWVVGILDAFMNINSVTIRLQPYPAQPPSRYGTLPGTQDDARDGQTSTAAQMAKESEIEAVAAPSEIPVQWQLSPTTFVKEKAVGLRLDVNF